MQDLIPERFKIPPFLVFYMIISTQIGIGILGYQRLISSIVGQDAWISVLIAGVLLHIILWMIYKIVETVNGDIVTAHVFVAGNTGGKLLSSIFIVYYSMYSLVVVRSFIEVIQVWMFPDISIFWFTVAIMLLCIYIVYGGFRTVVGIAFFGAVLPSYLIFTFSYNIQFAEFQNLFPIWDHSMKDLLLGAYHMSLTYIGFEIVLFFYPFIKEPQKSKKWAHLALLTTTFVYTLLMIITIVYFSEEQLQMKIWATLTMWKMVKLPFAVRFEYIGIATWILVILPNICISIWIASRLLRRIFSIRQKKGVLIIAFIQILVINFLRTRENVDQLNTYTGKAGFIFNFIYIPLLFIWIMIVKKVKKNE